MLTSDWSSDVCSSDLPWRREWQPSPVFLPGESHGQRSLAGYSPRGFTELDTTERRSTHTVLVLGFPGGSDGKESVCTAGDQGSVPRSGGCPGEGNDKPLQYSCLENPMDRGAWRATAHGVARVGHDLVTKPRLFLSRLYYFIATVALFKVENIFIQGSSSPLPCQPYHLKRIY